MKLSTLLLGVTLPLALSAPAHAAYVQLNFSGQVLAANAGTPAAEGIGAPVTFHAVFDPAKLVDRTQTVNDATGLGFTSVFAASLSDDPNASLTIHVGDVTFTKFDEVNYGTPEGDCGPGCDLGAGDFPAVTYLNGAFAGVGNMFINAAGYSFDADPIADAFGGFDLGDGNGGYQFILARPVRHNPFGKILSVGSYDAKAAVQSSAPEPAAWSLMILGFGIAGSLLRRDQAARVRS